MSKNNKNQDRTEKDFLDDEMTSDEVSRIFKKHPDEYPAKLEEIGFVYHDDESDLEDQEEAEAQPRNTNQEYLVAFFNGHIPLSEQAVEIFIEERRSLTPNLPLIRKYFKQANKHLLSLLLYGLHHYPVSEEFLTDLAYFHEFQNVLSTLINHYTVACDKQQNLEVFSDLVMDFYYATSPDGYDAFYALREKYPAGTDKRKVIDFLYEIEHAGIDEDQNDIEF